MPLKRLYGRDVFGAIDSETMDKVLYSKKEGLFYLRIFMMPPSVNHYWKTARTGRKFLSKEAREFRERIRKPCSFAHIRPQEGKFQIQIKLYFADKRRRDWDNYTKGICDALEGHAFIDDVFIQKGTIEKLYTKENPYVEVYVQKLKEVEEDSKIQATEGPLQENM